MTPKVSTAKHPSVAARAITQQLIAHATSPEEESAIQKVVELTIPPPTIRKLEEIAETLFSFNRISADSHEHLAGYVQRNKTRRLVEPKYLEETYPLGTTILRLRKKLATEDEYFELAIEQLLKLHDFIATPEEFSGGLFYTHLLAFRDSYLHFCENSSKLEGNEVNVDTFLLYLGKTKNDPLVSEHNQRKFVIAASLINRNLRLGGRQKPGYFGGRSTGKHIFKVDSATASEFDDHNSIESATVCEVFQSESEDDTSVGLSVLATLPKGTTSKDKRSITQRAMTGFARSNVISKADMRSLSRNTFSGFLTYAYDHANRPTYALIWLAAFIGFDTSRPVRVRADSTPTGEEALLRSTNRSLTYRVIRRLTQDDNQSFESAGTMVLALPKYVAEGLSELVNDAGQGKCIAASEKVSRKYSNTNPGLTPTLRRLKNSAILHVGVLKMKQFELCALGGRVFPALKGMSAYYPVSVHDLNLKFKSAYSEACKTLIINAPEFENTTNKTRHHKHIFTQRKNHTEVIKTLLSEIGRSYANQHTVLSTRGLLATAREVVNAVQVHEVARYVLQQFLLGVRPIGQVANLQISDLKHIIVWDKGSRLFSERSYTPLNETLRKFIQVSNENREILGQLARTKGIKLILGEPHSGLSRKIDLAKDENTILITRLTNKYFRHSAPIASTRVDPLFPFNWMRKASTEELCGAAPQWMLDELFGHRMCGREAFGIWSTIDARKFQRLDRLLSDLTASLLTEELQQPLRLSNG